MGEYFKPVNVTKKEFVHPHNVGDGLKWPEWVTRDSATMRRVKSLFASGAWAKDDDVRIVSDYGTEAKLLVQADGSLAIGERAQAEQTYYERTYKEDECEGEPFKDVSR